MHKIIVDRRGRIRESHAIGQNLDNPEAWADVKVSKPQLAIDLLAPTVLYS